MTDVMIDLETMGTNHDAPVLAIGAVEFNRYTGETGRQFYEIIDFQSALDETRPDSATVAWWLEQSEEARMELLRPGSSPVTVAEKFSAWCPDDIKPWGNGATFDITILESWFNRLGIEVPWAFYNVRDVRTVVDLADGIISKDKFEAARTGAHKALDDALHQVKYVSAMISALRGNSAS